MEGSVLHKGACVEQCPTAFYKESDMCQSEFLSVTTYHFYQWVALLPPAEAHRRCAHASDLSLLSTACMPWSCGAWGLYSIVWEAVWSGTEFTLCMWFLGCDQHCLQCHQANECSLCEAPFFLLDTQCVYKCGKGYYADHAQRKCIGKQSERDVVERNQGCRCVLCTVQGWSEEEAL